MLIGECLGIRWDDPDFEKRMISVTRSLMDRPYEDGKCARHIGRRIYIHLGRSGSLPVRRLVFQVPVEDISR